MTDNFDLESARRALAEADCLAHPLEVERALARMGHEITDRLAHANPLVYAVMNGGLVVAGRLLVHLAFPLEVGYLHATRYGHALRGKQLEWRVPPSQPPKGRSVLVVDDILDEGHTLDAIVEQLLAEGAQQVLTAVLIHKVHNRKAHPGMRADFSGLDLPDRFLFGCGMDYKGYWRNAGGIYALKDH